MAANTSPIFVGALKGLGAKWVHSDTAPAKKTLLTAGANGSLVGTIICTSTDTVDIDLVLYLNDGSVDYLVGAGTVQAGSGATASAPPLSLLQNSTEWPWVSTDGSFIVPAGWVLKGENQATPATDKVLTVVVLGGDF